MIISDVSEQVLLEIGTTTTLQTVFSCKWRIETVYGTIIEIPSSSGAPFLLKPSTDIRRIEMVLDDDTICPANLVYPTDVCGGF